MSRSFCASAYSPSRRGMLTSEPNEKNITNVLQSSHHRLPGGSSGRDCIPWHIGILKNSNRNVSRFPPLSLPCPQGPSHLSPFSRFHCISSCLANHCLAPKRIAWRCVPCTASRTVHFIAPVTTVAHPCPGTPSPQARYDEEQDGFTADRTPRNASQDSGRRGQ